MRSIRNGAEPESPVARGGTARAMIEMGKSLKSKVKSMSDSIASPKTPNLDNPMSVESNSSASGLAPISTANSNGSKPSDTVMMAALSPPGSPTTPTEGTLPALNNAKTTSNYSTVLKRSKTIINVAEQCVALPDGLPYSTIVWGEKYDPYDIEGRKKRAKEMNLRAEARITVRTLYSKYIVVGSELELNLSHRLRSRCIQKLAYLDKMVDRELEQLSECVTAMIGGGS